MIVYVLCSCIWSIRDVEPREGKLVIDSMNREIKFRAWSPKHGKYLYPYPNAFWILGEMTVFEMLKQADHKLEEYNQIVIEQYTSLKDQNGKEIYEGDILDWGAWDNGEGERGYVEYYSDWASFVVVFYSKYGGEGCDTMKDFMRHRKIDFETCEKCSQTQEVSSPYECEIIGNIHENKELLV